MVSSSSWTKIVVEIATMGQRFCTSRRGSVAIMIGLILPVLIGMVALGTEITFVLFKQRQFQVVADAAALGAATALQRGHPSFGVEARAIAASLGLQDKVNGVSITPNNPPTSGSATGNSSAVEVIVSQPQVLVMVTLFRDGLFNVTARAVALAGAGTGCVLQLGQSSTPGVNINNGANVNLVKCGLAVDSTGIPALAVTGGAVLNTQSVSTSGTTSISNGATINASDGIKDGQPAVPDPYAGVTMPSLPGGCSNGTNTQYKHSNSGLQTINPGVWCKGVSFTNDANVLLNPGVYYVDRNTFDVGGAVTMNGTGVTIVLTSSTGSGYATAVIGNGANVTLSAPTAGATAGIVFFGDRGAPANNTQNFGGGATINVNGALYFPTQKVVFQNGVNNPSGCTQLIGGTLQFQGGSKFQNNCPTGVAAIGGGNTGLVE